LARPEDPRVTVAALLVGRLAANPERRVGASGRSFVRFRLQVHDGDSGHFVLGTAFSETVQSVLLALGEGAAISVSGALKVGTWTPPDGGEVRVNMSIVADAILSLHERSRIDKAVAAARAGGNERAATPPAPPRARTSSASAQSRRQAAALWDRGNAGPSGFDSMDNDEL
jgi:single-stranded DNA-binding protein